ncbi:septum formation initiator family protein [Fibrella sp. WM1]|uniref:septum formation initiator family protein n=1 Tax=Fibrella musci TaxID=3242485 RepID=UPI0035218D47
MNLPRRHRFYWFTGLGFVGWMLFFDANDLRSQLRNWWKLRELEGEKTFYQEQIEAVKAERREVLGSQRLRVKYAREKYLMKKRTEDVYVLVDEAGKPIEK